MLQLSSALLANMDIRKLLGAFSASMREVVPHDAATLALYDEATGKLRVQFLGADGGRSAAATRCCSMPTARRRARRSARGSR